MCGGLTAQTAHPNHLKNMKARSIGPAAMSGRITTLACPIGQPNVIYAGAASGGVWRSRNAGTKWEPIFDGAPTQAIGAIAINPQNPDEIWVGTGEGNPRNSQNFGLGIFKSEDGGKNWMPMGLEKTRTIHRVIIHRDNPQVIWAASLGSSNGPTADRGVYKSADGGKTWRKVLFVNDLTGCADLVADPANPNKLYAAMWEYQRWPWFFKSGGKGSGLYVSHNGGETWERRTEKDGLPEGELGRIGLAVAPSNPEIVYALVEAKENALYKSVDGGRNWRKMADKNMGDRPFYYAEMYVSPKNENTIYSIHSVITRSIDGGRTFDNFIGYNDIHPDHHAFWINPNDPNHILNGNDGGVNISNDGGKTWRYAENIPVGQFYHVDVDNDMPYNVYGGLQDNGSWAGPSAIWKNGGMRNAEWQELYFGDGFDVMPRRDDNRYCFAMSQGGELGYIDRKTGETRYVKPLHPERKPLRWNWNSALAQDPFRDQGLYFGSQMVHYSPDLGHTWQIISPDLTTNDTSKMHQDQSGGLTLDATNAENYCTIMAIAPSPAQQGVVWVGTDDGQLQLTRDGGKNWQNLSAGIPGFPKGGWIPQIEVSKTNPGEAFVVVNNYRLNDFEPYLFHTADFGKRWNRLVSGKNVQGFTLSVVQDPVATNLLFLGTDQGLYYSLDYGTNWTHWPTTNATGNAEGVFPSVPVQDMKIHPRDGDLVLGTFGRALWIIDNLSPLREMAKNARFADVSLKVLPAQDGVLAAFASYDGPRFVADETFRGDNKSPIVRIPVWVKPSVLADLKKDNKDKKKDAAPAAGAPTGGGRRFGGGGPALDSKKEKVTVTIRNMSGDTIRRFKADVDSCLNYIPWFLDTKGARFPSNDEPNKEQLEPGGGPGTLPGTYRVVVELGKLKDSTLVKVIDDPRLPVAIADRQAQQNAMRDLLKSVEKAEKAYNRLKDAEKNIKLVEESLVNADTTKKAALKLGTALRDSIGVVKELFFQQKEPKGIQRNPNTVNAKFFTAMYYISTTKAAPNANAQIAIDEAKDRVNKAVEKVNALLDKPWKAYRAAAEQVKFSLFKE